jgi:putative membrane protein
VLLGEWSIRWLIGLGSLAFIYFGIYFRTPGKAYLQPLLFLACTIITYFTFGSPLTPVSQLSFSLHMIQMSIVYFFIPPLLLLSIRPFFARWRPATGKKCRYRWFAIFALYVFAVLFLMYHIPVMIIFLSAYPFIRVSYAVILFLLALCMWWPVTKPVYRQRVLIRGRQRYVLLSGLLLMPACMFFIVSGFMSGAENAFLDEMTAAICFPVTSVSLEILPAPFNTKYDQIASGVFMMAMHKVALMLTVKFGSTM